MLSVFSQSYTHVFFLSEIKLILVLFLQYSFKSSKQLWSPLTSNFGVPEEFTHLTNRESNSITLASLVARRRILLLWKDKNPPTPNS